MKYFFVVLCASFMAITACTKKDHKNDPIDPVSSNSYSFTMGGMQYSGFAGGIYTHTADNTILSIAGGSSSDPATMEPFGISIEFPDKETKTGTYASELFSYGGNYIGSVKVIITTLSATQAAGTFTGSAGNPGTGQTLSVENGKFDVAILQ